MDLREDGLEKRPYPVYYIVIMDDLKYKEGEGFILIIDDEHAVREAITDILQIEGIPVKTAANGKAGVQLYAQNPAAFKLVILDMSMPGLSGEDTFKQLKAINPDVKVILSSGYSQNDISPLIAQQEQVSFLAKPYKIDTLLNKIMEFSV